jgi:hypothetical protein
LARSTARTRGETFFWALKRGCSSSASGTFHYEQGDFDIAALVALPIDRVLFRIAPFHNASAMRTLMLAPAIERTS